MFYSYSSFYCSPFSSGGEPNNNVISVWYKFLNKHLLIITLAKRTWGGGNKISVDVTHSQGFTDSEDGDWGVRGPRGAWEAGEKLFGGRGNTAINGGSRVKRYRMRKSWVWKAGGFDPLSPSLKEKMCRSAYLGTV